VKRISHIFVAVDTTRNVGWRLKLCKCRVVSLIMETWIVSTLFLISISGVWLRRKNKIVIVEVGCSVMARKTINVEW
jgi:hypothetical protein